MTNTIFNKQFSNFARASAETTPSPKTSLIFAWPLTAKIGNKVNVNVFIRNANNLPLDKKTVKLVTSLGLVDGGQESTLESDKTGKATFTLISNSPGVAELTAIVGDNVQIDQKVSIKFE